MKLHAAQCLLMMMSQILYDYAAMMKRYICRAPYSIHFRAFAATRSRRDCVMAIKTARNAPKQIQTTQYRRSAAQRYAILAMRAMRSVRSMHWLRFTLVEFGDWHRWPCVVGGSNDHVVR